MSRYPFRPESFAYPTGIYSFTGYNVAKIYLSSTYTDLKACREAVYHVLRQMRHDVIAMEDYVATDQRPTEKCLADVAASELYIGILAWRYGYIPSEMNPEHKSITELEYRKAVETGKTCLLFLLDEEASWSRKLMDEVTGEGKRGKYITALRRELAQGKIVSFFQTPEELASLVSTAVNNWEKSRIRLDASNAPPSLDKGQSERAQHEERLKALIIDHRGFIQSRLESFVGRAQELSAIRQDISKILPTGGYLTITGQAGQGKSSIIARLVHDSHPNEVAHHFIPFNPGPDHQVSLLRDLMAQLILKHDLGDYYVASESRPALRDFFPKVLDAVAAKGTQEVIFIDGLDQLKEDADGERDLSFLPDNPPQGIVFVVGTRPNETLQPLELHKPHHPYLLPGLTRDDFDLILQHRNVHLEPGLADRFYKTMGENALYLDLIAKELAHAEAAKPEEIIERIADDPENIFTLSTTRLKRHGVEWREVLKPLLGVLLVTQEPLTGRQLRAILDLDDERLRAGIARLGGLVTDDGQQRYSLFHLKLYDYLRQDEKRPHKEYIFARDEEEGWHDTLARWCERGDLSLIWESVRNDPGEQGRREYSRKYYVTHLYRSHEWQRPQQQRLFAVLDTVQYGQAKIRDDPSTRSYALDLDLGRQATTWEGWTLVEGIALLPRLWQYTLLRCSLTSRADQYPEEAFRLLILLGRKQEALGLAELLTDPVKKVRVLQYIAEQLHEQASQESEWLELFMRAGEVARTITDSYRQAEALRALGSALAQAGQWAEAQHVIGAIQRSDRQAEALRALGSALAQAGQWAEAQRVIGTIQGSSQQARALRALGSALAQAGQWAEAKRVIGTIQGSSQQAWALSALGTALAQAGQEEQASQVLAQAERVIGAIQRSDEQAWALSALGSALAQAGQWAEAQRVIGTIQGSSQQAEALHALGTALAQAGQWAEAQRVIGTITDSYRQAWALSALITALAQAGQWAEAKRIIGTIQGSSARVEALHALGTALAQAGQEEQASQAWAEAKRIIGTIQGSSKRVEALHALGTALAQAGQEEQASQAWAEAKRVIGTIQGSSQQARALSALGTALAQAGQEEQASQVWAEAKRIIGTIQDSSQQARALSALGTALAQAGQEEQASQVWAEAKRIIGTIQGSSQQARALSALGTALAQAGQWAEAERVIGTIQDSSQQAEALHALATMMARTDKLEQLLHVIQRSWRQAETRVEALTLFSIVSAVISYTPDIGTAFLSAFSWVDNFLGG